MYHILSLYITVTLIHLNTGVFYTRYKTLITRSNRTKNFACIWREVQRNQSKTSATALLIFCTLSSQTRPRPSLCEGSAFAALRTENICSHFIV
uniref:Uncharacterized protein n=1 Tax=Caenorhabditis japonica TaxID=281687 RepID=A0A8R1EC58_CAEJA